MANTCNCAIAIAKKDLEKLESDEGRAIMRTNLKDGYEQRFIFTWCKNRQKAEVSHEENYHFGTETEHIWRWNGKVVDKEYIEKKRQEGWTQEWGCTKCVKDLAFSNGWVVDWKALNGYSYEMDTQVEEYDDHITVYFGGRWSFPEEVAETLNNADVEWQGAEAEVGCEVLSDTLGTAYFNLVAHKEKDDEGYWWYDVEDLSRTRGDKTTEWDTYMKVKRENLTADVRSVARSMKVVLTDEEVSDIVEKYIDDHDMTISERDMIMALIERR